MKRTKQVFHRIYQEKEYHLNDGHPVWVKRYLLLLLLAVDTV